MDSQFYEVLQKPSRGFLPLHASFKNIDMNGFLSTNFYHTRNYQVICINSTLLRTKFLYNHLNALLCKALAQGNQKDESISVDKHFMYLVQINCPPEDGNTFFQEGKLSSRIISNIVNCLSLLIKNCFLIFKCLNVFETFSICTEVDYIESSIPNFSLKEFNVYDEDAKSVCLYNKCHKYISALKSQNKSPLFNHFYFKNPSYSRSINTFLKKWNKYQATALFLQTYKKLFSRRTQRGDSKAMSSIYDTNMELKCVKNTSGDNWINNSTSLRVELISTLNNSVSKLSFQEINTLISVALKNIEKETFFKTLLYDTLNNSSLFLLNKCTSQIKNQAAILWKDTDYSLVDTPQESNLIQNGNTNVPTGVIEMDNLHLHSTFPAIKKVLDSNNFIIGDRNIYIPKGLSPMMNIINKSSSIFSKIAKKKQWHNIKNNTLGFNLGYSKKFYQKRNFRSLDKSIFSSAHVIGQVDKKYILCDCYLEQQLSKTVKYLFILDQHAIDERIQLENLLAGFKDSGDAGNFKTYPLREKLILDEISPKDIKILFQFSCYFYKYGILFKETLCHRLTVTAVPEFLHWLATRRVTDYSDYLNFIKISLNTIVLEQLTSIKETGSTTNIIPSDLNKYFCQEACHSAVNFGKTLSISNCEDIVKKLASCSLPFMCAHGRPVICFLGELPSNSRHVLPPTFSSLQRTEY